MITASHGVRMAGMGRRRAPRGGAGERGGDVTARGPGTRRAVIGRIASSSEHVFSMRNKTGTGPGFGG